MSKNKFILLIMLFGFLQSACKAEQVSLEGKLPDLKGLKITLCDKYILNNFYQGIEAAKCNGAFEKTITINENGYFCFTNVPAGSYYILVDIPESLKDKTPYHCRTGEYLHWGPIENGIQVMCLSGTDLGPTILIVDGLTLEYTE